MEEFLKPGNQAQLPLQGPFSSVTIDGISRTLEQDPCCTALSMWSNHTRVSSLDTQIIGPPGPPGPHGPPGPMVSFLLPGMGSFLCACATGEKINTAGFCLALLSGEWTEEGRCFDHFTALSFIPLNTCVRKMTCRGKMEVWQAFLHCCTNMANRLIQSLLWAVNSK